MANTASLSPDEIKKQAEQLKKDFSAPLPAGILGKSASQQSPALFNSADPGIPSAPPADITKAARPLTGGASTPPPATNGGPPHSTSTVAVGTQLPSYPPTSEGLKKQLARPDTSSIPNVGDPGALSNISSKGLAGELVKTNLTPEQVKARGDAASVLPGVESSTRGPSVDNSSAAAIAKGMRNQPTRTGEAVAGAWDAVKEKAGAAWDQLTAKPDYGKGLRDTNRYRK